MSDLKPAVRYISRFRGDGIDGWRYQPSSRDGCAQQAVYFSVAAFGSLELALAQAQAHSINENGAAMKRHARSWDSRSPFDFCGVSLQRTLTKAGSTKSYQWVASWTEVDGAPQKRRFPIAVYGYEGAFLNAAYERIRAVGAQPGLNPHIPPGPPDDLAQWMSERGIRYGDDGRADEDESLPFDRERMR